MTFSFTSNLEQVAAAFHLPGIAVAAVQQGRVVYSVGFGYRNLADRQPFTTDTLCLIASATKSFTATLAGCLVDQGVIDWTTPVREYMPHFRMVDEYATNAITLEDMFCHRSGLPWHENLLAHGVGRELSDTGREFRADLLKRLAYFDPSTPFRTHFQYQDIVYTCGGAVLEHVMDEAYEVLVDRYLLQPLGMVDSTFARSVARMSCKLATGYASVDGEWHTIPFCDTRDIAPCAGLYSSVDEMTTWLQLQLNRGRAGTKQIVSEESLDWIHRPHMVTPERSDALGGRLTTYGQGWQQSVLHGRMVIAHGGSFNGYRTFMGFVPDADIAAVVMTNLNLTDGVTAAGMVVLDELLGVEMIDARIAHYQRRSQMFSDRDAQTKRDFEVGRNLSNPPAHPLHAYEGAYSHPGYGTFTVELRQDLLYQTYDGRAFPLAPYDGETLAGSFQSTENRLLDMTFTFEADGHGQMSAVRVPIVPDIPTPRFVKER